MLIAIIILFFWIILLTALFVAFVPSERALKADTMRFEMDTHVKYLTQCIKGLDAQITAVAKTVGELVAGKKPDFYKPKEPQNRPNGDPDIDFTKKPKTWGDVTYADYQEDRDENHLCDENCGLSSNQKPILPGANAWTQTTVTTTTKPVRKKPVKKKAKKK